MEVDDCFRFVFWKFRRGLYVPTYNLEGFSLEINDFGKASTATKTLKRDFPSAKPRVPKLGCLSQYMISFARISRRRRRRQGA